MISDNLTTPAGASHSQRLQSFWQLVKSKRISYFTLPLIVMATVVEVVILTTGWKYQKAVCVPQGMGVTFFGIGPIGAVILAVEMLKLPLAIWTASRTGWQKGVMIMAGLPLICVLTFQLVKDMAVYEMGIAMTPATQALEKATAEEVKISQLKGELVNVTAKRTERERKLAELAAKKDKAKSDFEEALKLNAQTRQDAISLTDYQKQSLSEVETRQASVIKQADADSAALQKQIADLRARRETEVVRASSWNEEEARIENDYKTKMAEYANKRRAYEKDLAAYNSANFLKRKLMTEPVDPGVAPVREENKILKPVAIAEIDAQIKAKEIELTLIGEKRRARVAQIEDDARRVREQFDNRSASKREEADKKREELVAAKAKLDEQFAAEEKEINADYAAAAAKVDGVRAEMDAATKAVEQLYEEREAAIRKTQVYRIATTVEIIRGLVMGQRPVTIKATAKERGDLYTDQISMVRIWVYPVLAFIVAFLPTLMVEIGFSTLFKPEKPQRTHRLGFFGRRMHELYIRAGRQKIARAERLARAASAEISGRDNALATMRADCDKALVDKETELQATRDQMTAASAQYQEQLNRKEGEWVAKYTELAESLNRAIAEKDAMRDMQKTEVERQIQMRQNAWSERLAALHKELDSQRAAAEKERTALMHEHHRKLMEVSENSKEEVAEARRRTTEAEMAAVEASSTLSHDLKEALKARDAAEAQLKQQTEMLSVRLTQAKEDAAREVEKVTRVEKQRFERQQAEFDGRMREREEDFERRLRQREQDLTAAFDVDLKQAKAAAEDLVNRRETELQRQMDTRVREVDARWKQELDKREESMRIKLLQREQQLEAQAELRLNEVRAQAEEELRRQQAEAERRLSAQAHDADARLLQELQQKELALHARLKQRELELAGKAAAREAELQNQWSSEIRAREEKAQRQADARVQSVEAMLNKDSQEKEEMFQAKLRQRDEEWQGKLDAARAELRAQADQELRRRDMELAEFRSRDIKELEIQLRKSIEEKHTALLSDYKKREQEMASKLAVQAETLQKIERERDEAKQLAFDKRRQVHDLNNRLSQVSLLLGGHGNGNGVHLPVANVGRNS